MDSTLVNFSDELARIVEAFSPSVVAVDARPHFPSSGVHWRQGVIVTADHTLRREEDIEVTLPDGKTVGARLAGRDPGTDLAVLKVEGLAFPTANSRLGEATKAGHFALVLGRSRDSGPNASLGVISAVSGSWRTWRGGRLDQYVRLDATLFPNSSGGAVVDVRGKILGIATSALSRIAGLAIPVSTVNRVTDKLLERGHVPRGYLGIGLQPIPIPEALRAKLSLANKAGVLVLNVEPRGPADKAGLLVGDLLVKLGDLAIEELEDLYSLLDSESVGRQVQAKVIRGGALAELTIVVGERPRQGD